MSTLRQTDRLRDGDSGSSLYQRQEGRQGREASRGGQAQEETVEVWKQIPGSRFEVSNLGFVRNGDGRPIKRHIAGRGPKYWFAGILYNDGRRQATAVHNVMAAAFLGPRQAGLVCRHLDGDSLNCRIENIVYGTHAENMADRDAHGHTSLGSRNGQAKMTEQAVIELFRNAPYTPDELRALAAKYGMTHDGMKDILKGRSWKWLRKKIAA